MNDAAKLGIGIAACTALIIADTALLLATDMPMWLFWVILAVAIVLVFVPMLSFKGTQASVSGGHLLIKAPFVDLDIPLSSIQAVECRTTFDPGLRRFGYGGIKSGSGDFTNKEFGVYTFAGTTKIPLFIIIRHSGKKIVAFNAGDEAETMALYREISASTGKGHAVISSEESEKASKSHRSLKYAMIAMVVVGIVIAVAVVALVMIGGHVSVGMDDDSLEIDATMMHQDIAFSDISSVELRDDVDYGMRVGGYGGADISSGNFRNSEFGNYRLALHNGVDLCIVVHHSGGVTVFNLDSEQSTEDFYHRLSAAISDPVYNTPADFPVPAV